MLHRIGAQLGVVRVRRQHEGSAAAPAAHELRCQKLFGLGGLGVGAQVLAEEGNMLFEPSVGQVASVAGQHRRLGKADHRPVLIRIAENELTRFQWVARTRGRVFAGTLDHWL